ncbi:MAG: hypothetical protein V4484_18490 [Pseudomonadota bacterium]
MPPRFKRLVLTALLFASALAPFPSHAAKVMEMEADDMMRAVSHVKDTLALTPNQQILWQQVSSKSTAMLRIRQSRREKLQAMLKAALADPRGELRELDSGVDAETSTSAAENKELRALWLSVNDALDDQQRQKVAQFMISQLDRVEAPPRAAGPGPERGEGGQRHHKPDSAGGPPRF